MTQQFAILVSVLCSQSAILLESTKETSALLTRCGCWPRIGATQSGQTER